MVTTKSRSQQGFWEPSDLFKGKSDTAIAEKYREFCCKFQPNWTRISMLWKRKYRWTHLQINITTSCIASAVIFSPPSFPATTCFQCWELFLLATAAIGERVWLSRNMFVSCSSTRPTIHFQIYWLKMNAIWGQIFFIWKFFLCPKFASKVRRCGKIQCFRPRYARSCPPCYLVLSYLCNWLLNWKLCPILSSPFILLHFEIFLMTLSLCLFVFVYFLPTISLLTMWRWVWIRNYKREIISPIQYKSN